MKKTIFALLIGVYGLTPVFAQELTVITEGKKQLFTSNEQLPYQQLIGYAIEASSTAFTEGVKVGFYSCEKIYSMEGYNELPKYPCELFVHSKQGPIVVRYKEVTESMDEDIKKFLAENQLGASLYYNKGRFRFEVDENSRD